jgi:hypothetical protein
MRTQFARTAFFTLITCGVGCMAYSIKSDAKDFELLWLFLVMIFSFWTASAKFDDAFKK